MRTPEQSLVIHAWNLLNNGQGGIEWSGFELVCAHLGVTDIEDMMTQLCVIKLHNPERDNGTSDTVD